MCLTIRLLEHQAIAHALIPSGSHFIHGASVEDIQPGGVLRLYAVAEPDAHKAQQKLFRGMSFDAPHKLNTKLTTILTNTAPLPKGAIHGFRKRQQNRWLTSA